METIPIVHCFDHNYVLQAAVCFYSLLEHTSPDRNYCIAVIGRNLTQEDKTLLTKIVTQFPQATINIVDAPELDLPDIPKRTNFSKDIFYKFLIADLFPDYTQVIIADVDVVYQGDVADVFEMLADTDDAIIAAPLDISYAAWRGEGILRDLGCPKSLERYHRKLSPEKLSQLRFGAGFMVYNLKRIRELKLSSTWITYTKQHFSQIILPEQDVLNYVSGDQMKPMGGHAMAIAGYYAHYEKLTPQERADNPAWDEMFTHPIQIHYASGIKPWKYPDSPMANLWFDALLKSGLFPLWLKWIDNAMHGENRKIKRRSIFNWSIPVGKKIRFRLSLTKERLLK